MKSTQIIISLLMVTNIYAHTLVMNILDNKDDTITVVGTFSTGEKAVDAMIRLEALHSANILFEKRLPDEGKIIIPIPKEAYQVVLDGGPDHKIVQQGIAPLKGYILSNREETTEKRELSESISSKNNWSLPYIVLMSITLLLIGLSVYFSKKNTDKILQMIQEH